MAPIDTESQFKFLIACIKHTNAGKVDFGKVAEELSIVTKGAAAKRYERLMKAHGIEKSNGGGANSAGASGPSTPATPKTPATGRKNASNRATPASKKRKMAAPGYDVDEEEDMKLDIKEEAKLEESTNTPNGSYIIDPNNPPTAAPAADTLVRTPDGAKHDGENNDDVLLVSESRREDGAAPVVFAHQVLLPPPTEGFYGFVDPATNVHHLPQHPIAATDVPIRYEYGHADYATQTMAATLPPDGRHWLHHHNLVFFWSDAYLELHGDIKHD
ncbi:hypothetical protein INS49_011714 [Diaporthe citri]|uniref:uncharacterized protein n=1 Tax=Diaporthe citri TaxID=83186 RepID=UPI001C7FE1FA|nr:uncharacterized protein INS49_011714 [Diaporthe citri]KAG6360649.1 hypothetical protein INS49_011714 [Diaporthe citri]